MAWFWRCCPLGSAVLSQWAHWEKVIAPVRNYSCSAPMAAPYLCKDEDDGENREKRKESFERESESISSPLSLSSAWQKESGAFFFPADGTSLTQFWSLRKLASRSLVRSLERGACMRVRAQNAIQYPRIDYLAGNDMSRKMSVCMLKRETHHAPAHSLIAQSNRIKSTHFLVHAKWNEAGGF